MKLQAFLYAVAGMARLPEDYPTLPMNGISGQMRMPLIGFGTWEFNESVAEDTVGKAFRLGYRHVDTALVYDNHKGVGRALAKSTVPRDEYFVTTKIVGGQTAEETVASLEKSLAELKLDYVDLMLIHFPAGWNGENATRSDRQAQWMAMEAWAKTGKARALGVSHHCRHHIEDILAVATVPIALNQVQYHVGMGSDTDIHQHNRNYMQQLDIIFMSYSTLCGPCPNGGNTELASGELVTSIGKAHGKTGAQVSLKWAVQQGIPIVPKSTQEDHMVTNFDIFDFQLTQEEMALLSSATSPPLTPDDAGDCAVGGSATVDGGWKPDLKTGLGALTLGLVVGALVSGCFVARLRRRRIENVPLGQSLQPVP